MLDAYTAPQKHLGVYHSSRTTATKLMGRTNMKIHDMV